MGLDEAEKIAQAMQVDASPEGSPPQLKSLLENMFGKFPTAPGHLKTIPQPLTWKTYALAVQGIINWKSPLDDSGDYQHNCLWPVPWESKGEQLKLFEGKSVKFTTDVRFGFIPTQDGELGMATILLCIAHKFAVFGMPTSFCNISVDDGDEKLHTAYFIRHDRWHNAGIYGERLGASHQFKKQWVLSGGLQRFLGQISLTNVVVRYLFLLVWESEFMSAGLRQLHEVHYNPPLTPEYVRQQEEVFRIFPKLYVSLFSDFGRFSSEKDLEQAFQLFKAFIFSPAANCTGWENMPHLLDLRNDEQIQGFASKELEKVTKYGRLGLTKNPG